MRKQHSHSSALKAKVVLEALRETKTLAQIATEYEVHPTLVTKWKAEAIGNLPTLFERGTTQDERQEASERKTADLYQEIGRLTPQLNWMAILAHPPKMYNCIQQDKKARSSPSYTTRCAC